MGAVGIGSLLDEFSQPPQVGVQLRISVQNGRVVSLINPKPDQKVYLSTALQALNQQLNSYGNIVILDTEKLKLLKNRVTHHLTRYNESYCCIGKFINWIASGFISATSEAESLLAWIDGHGLYKRKTPETEAAFEKHLPDYKKLVTEDDLINELVKKEEGLLTVLKSLNEDVVWKSYNSKFYNKLQSKLLEVDTFHCSFWLAFSNLNPDRDVYQKYSQTLKKDYPGYIEGINTYTISQPVREYLRLYVEEKQLPQPSSEYLLDELKRITTTLGIKDLREYCETYKINE